jgi:hypothetical protein
MDCILCDGRGHDGRGGDCPLCEGSQLQPSVEELRARTQRAIQRLPAGIRLREIRKRHMFEVLPGGRSE